MALAAAIALSPSLAARAADGAAENPELRARLTALARPEGRTIGSESIAAVELLPKLYADLDYKLAWADPSNAAALKEAVQRSWEDGLLPSDFHASALAQDGKAMASPAAAADRDLIMSDALARLLYQLYFGKVSPNGLDPNWNFKRAALQGDPARIIAEALKAKRVPALVDRARIDHPLYSGLKATLQAYTQIEVSGGWPQVPPGPTVKPGATDPRIPTLRARLKITGEFQGSDAAAKTLDEQLSKALSRFQTSHGLASDGALGAQTVAALNVSVHDRIEQIRLNLERGRWLLRDLEKDLVAVNIAGFYLHLVLNGKSVWTTRVIVGKPYTKTPIFTETMKTIVFNPDWTAPRSIVRNEIFPKASANPGYLTANNYYLTDANGMPVEAPGDWSQWTAATFPYGVVQRPGTRNALGQVKFLFPNKYSVYLHDTPGREAFDKAGRTFSHGCIRVQNPLKFAELILRRQAGWDRAKIDAVVASGKMQSVKLERPLPVLVLYWTVDPSFDGGASFYQDIYGRDAQLLKALNAPFR